MLQSKDITKIQEIETFFKETWVQPSFFAKHLELFHFKKTSSLFRNVKTSGFSYWDLFKVLLILPYTGVKNIRGLVQSPLAPKVLGKRIPTTEH
jgi:hypothetical protein